MTVLIIVGAIAVALILILLVRLHCVAEYGVEGLSLYARVLFLRIVIIPARIKKERKKAIAEKDVKKAGSAVNKLLRMGRFREEEIGAVEEILSYVRLALGALGRLRRNVVIKKLTLHVTFAGNEDAYSAALNHGRLNAAASAILPLITNSLRVRRTDISSSVNFTSAKTEIFLYANIYISVYAAITIIFGALFGIWKMIPGGREKGTDDKAAASAG